MPIYSPSTYLNNLNRPGIISVKNLSRLALGVSLGLVGNAYSADLQSDGAISKETPASVGITAFNIEGGTLDAVISHFGRQSGVLVSVNAQLSQGKHSQGVQGHYTVEQALTLLLQGTGLTLIRQPQGGYIIITSPQSGSDVMTLSALQINDSALNNSIMVRDAIEQAPSTTRSNVPILETSRSIQVINREFIDDADVLSLNDALQYVSGSSKRQRMGGVDVQYYLRGFREGGNYRNGKRELFELRTNMNTVETVDVLKGPSAVRFGVNSPGGIVNYTTKRPEAETSRSVKVRADEHGQREIIGDFTGATNESETILYRFIASGEDSETFRDSSEQKTSTIAPSFTFLLSDKTQLMAAYELYRTEISLDRGLPIGELSDGTPVIADVPIDRKVSEPGDTSVDDTQLFDLTLAHQFNDTWQGEISYSYQKWDSQWSDVQNEGFYPEAFEEDDGSIIPAGSVIRERVGYIDREQETHQGSALMFGDFELAGIQHKVTLGVDYTTSDLEGTWGEGEKQPATAFNIYNPVYGEFSTGLTPIELDTETTDTQGVFVSETAYFGESLIVNLATRYDYFDYQYKEEYEDPTDNYYEQTKDEALTWNAGLLYKVAPSASLYLSYSTSYEPNSADNLVGELEPQEGEQWEVGVKGFAMNDMLEYSVVFYDIIKSNIPNEIEAVNPDDEDMIELIGEQTSRGVELDTTWQVTEDFNVLASYAYIDAEIKKDEKNEGNTPPGVPEHSAALFTSYNVTSLDPGLTVMAGVNYVDDVPNRADNKLMIPGFTQYDIALKYRMPLAQEDVLLIQTGIKNLTDERIYIQQGNDSVGIGQARTVYANLEYQF